MDLDFSGHLLLGAEALACLGLGFWAWREAANEPFGLRAIGPVLGCAAAALILYGLAHS